MTLSTPTERMMMFGRGYRDGAGVLAHRHPDDDDYMAGWRMGESDGRIARVRYSNMMRLRVDGPTREGA